MKSENEIKEQLYNKIDSVKGEKDLKRIYVIVESLRDYLDSKDSWFENLLDHVMESMSRTTQGKIHKMIDDILSNYSKKDKKGNPHYSDDDKAKIEELILEIDKVCNENFLDRFKNMLKGS